MFKERVKAAKADVGGGGRCLPALMLRKAHYSARRSLSLGNFLSVAFTTLLLRAC